jgi:predicted NBD/HSP70 family sugar kinase
MAALRILSSGEILELIVSGRAVTRSSLSRVTGLSRSTVAERLDALFEANLIREGDLSPSTGGRPSRTLTLNADSHLTLAADIGEDHVRLVLTDLQAQVLAESVGAVPVAAGPEKVLDWILAEGSALVRQVDRRTDDVIGVGLAVPAPVDFARGEVTGPSVMTGWEKVPIAVLVQRAFDVPVVVENDVNARGLGEYLSDWRSFDDVFYVKAGTGIGSAILSAGTLFRGAKGAAGDIGHIRMNPESGPLCRCGSIGCVEALAAGWSLVRDLRARGFDVSDTRQAMQLIADNSPEASQLLRQAGRYLGQAVAYSVSLLNPSLVVVGGSLTLNNEHLLAGIRESVYQYCLPLATRDLQIVQARGDERSGAVGAAHLVITKALTSDRVDRLLASASVTDMVDASAS